VPKPPVPSAAAPAPSRRRAPRARRRPAREPLRRRGDRHRSRPRRRGSRRWRAHLARRAVPPRPCGALRPVVGVLGVVGHVEHDGREGSRTPTDSAQPVESHESPPFSRLRAPSARRPPRPALPESAQPKRPARGRAARIRPADRFDLEAARSRRVRAAAPPPASRPSTDDVCPSVAAGYYPACTGSSRSPRGGSSGSSGSGSLGLHVEAMTTSSSTIRGGSCR
jgi:hypothetical protein